ncbi:RUN/FYVE domain protein [Actinidia rufa]|uniref:RUN/FYVE domain protein n=1 Tax=Actinidia rufa TaxID=165716 RepID=A0A7J0ES55_9ERIC|nr:RUN/FYVE domain protein [Actinidia rufa]
MELLKLSKFKLQLRALVTEVRELRVSYLQSDNALLENKQQELKGTITNLLQSRENFVKVYEDSTSEMKRCIQTKDRKLTILSEKISAHLVLFDSIQKEAFSVKQVLDNVQHLVSEKEGIGTWISELTSSGLAGLKRKMDELSAYEKVFVEKISELESKLRNDENELRRKDRIISQLESQLEEEKISNDGQPQIEEISIYFPALYLELRSLGIILQKIQDSVINMNEEDRRAFSSALGGQEECTEIKEKEHNRIEDVYQKIGENSPRKAYEGGTADNTALVSQEHDSLNNPMQRSNNLDSCISEFTCSSPPPTYSEPQAAANVLSISVTEAKANCTTSVYHQDSESSTTQPEASKDPD